MVKIQKHGLMNENEPAHKQNKRGRLLTIQTPTSKLEIHSVVSYMLKLDKLPAFTNKIWTCTEKI